MVLESLGWLLCGWAIFFMRPYDKYSVICACIGVALLAINKIIKIRRMK